MHSMMLSNKVIYLNKVSTFSIDMHTLLLVIFMNNLSLLAGVWDLMLLNIDIYYYYGFARSDSFLCALARIFLPFCPFLN